MSTSRKRRQREFDVNVYIPEDSPPPEHGPLPPPPPVMQRHTTYTSSSTTARNFNVSNSYYEVPGSPQKGRPTDHDTLPLPDDEPPMLDFTDVNAELDRENRPLPPGWMDPAYDPENASPPKRERTKASVSPYNNLAKERSDILVD